MFSKQYNEKIKKNTTPCSLYLQIVLSLQKTIYINMAKKRTKDDYPIMDTNGQIFNAPVYQDDNGNAYTVDGNGNTYYVERQNTFDSPIQLDDVNVYAPSPQYMLDNALSQYSTLSNDKSKVLNTSHRPYNTHLEDNAQRGAISHNTWTKEHPNLNAWGYVPSVAAMTTAAYPFVAGIGSAALGTAAGQLARAGISKFMNHPISLLADQALGWYGGVHGVQDVLEGKFTPMTALDFMGVEPAVSSVLRANKWLESGLGRSLSTRRDVYRDIYNRFNPKLEDTSESIAREAFQETPTPNINPIPAFDEIPEPSMNISPLPTYSSSINDNSEYLRSAILNDINPILETPPSELILDDAMNVIDRVASANSSTVPLNKSFKVRDVRKGEQPYTTDEVRNIFFNEDGSFIGENRLPQDAASVYTGAHGDFYGPFDRPQDALKKHLFNVEQNKRELQDIISDNPSGRSGIILHTHHSDLSADSAPLAYTIGMRQGEHFMPFPTESPTVMSNTFGYNNFFKESPEIAERARTYYRNHPNAEDVELLTDANGNMTAFKITDENGEFLVPLRTQEEYLNVINKRIDAFNKKFKTDYPHATLKDAKNFNRKTGEWVPKPWSFGRKLMLPNIFGVAYENGGKVKKKKKKLMTQL